MLLWIPLGIAAFTLQVLAPALRIQTAGMQEPGIVFSIKQAESFNLDPYRTYEAILDELHPKYVRLIAYWDRIEKQQGVYDFSEFDRYVKKSEQAGVRLTLIAGRKVPRWPECHIPAWAAGLSAQEQNQALQAYLSAFVQQYRASGAVELWQVENEPFLNFGPCDFSREVRDVASEVGVVRSLDARPVLVTASGELDTWLRAFLTGDQVGVSLYRRFFVTTPWFRFGLQYPLAPLFYKLKGALLQTVFPGKRLMVTELQLEPWLPQSIVSTPLKQQFKELPFSQFQNYISYARQTGIPRIYLWGGEWWYWLKERNYPEYWNYVRTAVFAH